MWLNATSLYRKLEIVSQRRNIPMQTISQEIFGEGQRIQQWRNGRIPSQRKLRDVQLFIEATL